MPRITAVGHAVVADREVVQRALGLRAPVAVGGHLDRAHAVGLGAGAAGASLMTRRYRHRCVTWRPSSDELSARLRPRPVRRTWRSMLQRTYGPSSPAPRASVAVWQSAVITSRSRSMPRTIAAATCSGLAGLDRGGDARGLRRLELVLGVEARASSVSGGYAHATTMPCGASSARSVSARPRTANFAGRVGAVAEHAR